jgi:ubiquinone biosynthesis protein UbiJ
MAGSRFDALIRRGLAGSPRARELCSQLAGQSVAIDVTGIARRTVRSDGDTLEVLRPEAFMVSAAQPAAAPSAVISGSPLSLLALVGPAPEAVLQRGDVRIQGDVEIAQKFREVFFLLRPDLEEELSRLIGDAPAHQLGRAARAVAGWGLNAARSAALNVAEYLGHERGDLVPRPEGESFFHDVDRFREAVDRLDARLAMLRPRNEGK